MLVPWGLEEGIEFVVVVEVERWSCVGENDWMGGLLVVSGCNEVAVEVLLMT